MRNGCIVGAILCSALLAACSPLAQVNQGDLESVVSYYYGVGQTKPPSGRDTYPLLSEKTKAQIGQDQWMKKTVNLTAPDSATVLRKAEQSGSTYGLVSVTSKGADGMKAVATNTWILEHDKWRLLNLSKSEEEADLAFQNGDFARSESKAQDWLRDDPFSLEAYYLLAMSSSRQAAADFSDRSADVVRSVIAINPNDSTANFIAVSFTSDPDLALTFLKRLEGTYSYSQAAMNLALKYEDFQKRLDYLKSILTEPKLEMMEAQCFAALGNFRSALAILTKEGFTESLQAQMTSEDPSYASNWAGTIGVIAHYAGEDKLARTWLDYGISRDPNAESVKNLASVLRK